VVLDADMLAHERLNCHPLVNTMTTGIARHDLIAFLRATGHEPLIVPVTGRAVDSANDNCQNVASTPS
jgi:Ala-tRNA(Pro) deacylase